MPEATNAIEEAIRAGFDMALIEENLSLTPEERALRHDQALALVLELDQIRAEEPDGCGRTYFRTRLGIREMLPAASTG